MVDGYMGKGLKWSRIFADAALFEATMRTAAMKKVARRLVAATTIRSVTTGRSSADVILCRVASRTEGSAI